MTPSDPGRRYLPAASHDFFLPAYDPLMRVLGFSRFADALIDQAELQPGFRVLDVGCGTGTLAIRVLRRFPGIEVSGVDPDPKAIARARRKAERAGLKVRFERAFGDETGFPDATFDRVFSSMMFHHLYKEDKPKVLAEIGRVLKPGGRLQLLDFAGGGPPNMLARLIHGSTAGPAAEDRLVRRMTEAGFANGRRIDDRQTIFGAVAFYEATAAPGARTAAP